MLVPCSLDPIPVVFFNLNRSFLLNGTSNTPRCADSFRDFFAGGLEIQGNRHWLGNKKSGDRQRYGTEDDR